MDVVPHIKCFMGIAKILFEDWTRERKIKKHRAEIDAILKKSQSVRVTSPQGVCQSNETTKTAETGTHSSIGNPNEKKADMTMEGYDASGQLDADVKEREYEQRLNRAVASVNTICQKENANPDGLIIECSHDGQNIHISVFDKQVVVGKWRFMLQPAGCGTEPIRLYHLNYHHNQTPGSNYHLQHQAKELYTPEDVAVYILRHDKKKAVFDRKKRQEVSNCDDLIGD